MSGLSANCPISTRPMYFGTRRIAPAAAISRIQALGARPAVETLRPAHYRVDSEIIEAERVLPPGAPVATFLCQLLAQNDGQNPADPRIAAARYLAADDLGLAPHSIVIATL